MNLILDIPLGWRLMLLFGLGACLGAAVNLAVDRLRFTSPRWNPWNSTVDAMWRWLGRSVAPADDKPAGDAGHRSRKAKTKIALLSPRTAADRIPIVGWMRLRREAPLRGNFWMRPFLVEVVFGLAVAWFYWWQVEQLALVPFLGDHVLPAQVDLGALHLQYLGHLALLVMMLAATLIDLDEWFIPDAITIPGTLIALGLACLPASQLTVPTLEPPNALVDVTYLQVASPQAFPTALAGEKLNSLWLALGCYWLWIVALLPRVWRWRRGLKIAWWIFWRRIARADSSSWLLVLGMVGSAGIAAIWYAGGDDHWASLLSSLIGLAVGLVTIWTIRLVGAMVLRREAMGFGDVTLMGMIGAFLGWQPCLMVFFIGPFFGLVPGLAQLFFRRDRQVAIPYGPFLCAGAATTMVYWAALWQRTEHIFELGWLVPAVLAICAPLLIVLLLLLQLVKRLLGARG